MKECLFSILCFHKCFEICNWSYQNQIFAVEVLEKILNLISRKNCEMGGNSQNFHSAVAKQFFFPLNQFIVKFFSKTLIWRNFCERSVYKFRNFHSCCAVLCDTTVWKFRKFSLTLFSQKFRESNGFTR